MKRILLLLSFVLSSLSVYGQQLYAERKVHIVGVNHDIISRLLSINGRDTVRATQTFHRLWIEEDQPNIARTDFTDYLFGDYAIGRIIDEVGDTSVVCINKDLSMRFSYPVKTIDAEPFNNGISICWSGTDFAMDPFQRRFGAVTREGWVLFNPVHDYVNIVNNKAIALDLGSCDSKGLYWHRFIIKRNDGDTLAIVTYCCPYDFLITTMGFTEYVYNKENDKYYDGDFLFYDRGLYSAFFNVFQLDFLSAEDNLKEALNSDNPIIRKCARKNLKALKGLFNN